MFIRVASILRKWVVRSKEPTLRQTCRYFNLQFVYLLLSVYFLRVKQSKRSIGKKKRSTIEVGKVKSSKASKSWITQGEARRGRPRTPKERF